MIVGRYRDPMRITGVYQKQLVVVLNNNVRDLPSLCVRALVPIHEKYG